MSGDQYRLVRSLEETHWWFRGVRELMIGSILDDAAGSSGAMSVLDAGCGSGLLLGELPFHSRVGLDFSAEVLDHARRVRGIDYIQASVMELPLKDDGFDVVVSIDVLSNAGVSDDGMALRELQRVLKPGGLLLLNLPAFEWLRSGHDRVADTRHRYRSSELRDLLMQSGFRDIHVTYRVIVVFPVAAVIRLAKRKAGETDVRPTSAWMNRVLLGTLRLENRFASRWHLPFGLSLFARARK